MNEQQRARILEGVTGLRSGAIEVTGARVVQDESAEGSTVLVTVLLRSEGAGFAPDDVFAVRKRSYAVVTSVLGESTPSEVVYADVDGDDEPEPAPGAFDKHALDGDG